MTFTQASANNYPPTITGTPQQGQTLTSSQGTWSNAPTSFANRWQRCNASGDNSVDISSGTSTSYALTASEVSATVRVAVTATNSSGSTIAVSATTAVVTSFGPHGGDTFGSSASFLPSASTMIACGSRT